MTEIVLTAEQSRQIAAAPGGQIRLRTCDGDIVGYVAPYFTKEEIAQAESKLKSGMPFYTTQQVLAHLRSLGPE